MAGMQGHIELTSISSCMELGGVKRALMSSSMIQRDFVATERYDRWSGWDSRGDFPTGSDFRSAELWLPFPVSETLPIGYAADSLAHFLGSLVGSARSVIAFRHQREAAGG
ncbi:hypothetical protein LINPERHAP1_LOCUS19045 [Linum perenne]